jgi:hypothetical protein
VVEDKQRLTIRRLVFTQKTRRLRHGK